MQQTHYSPYHWITAFITSALLLSASVAFADTNDYYYSNGSENSDEESRDIDVQLSGSQEVPSVNTDTTGRYWTSFDESGSNMTNRLDVYSGDEIVAAHLHCAAAGVNGPVVVSIFSDSNGTDVNGQLSSGSINDNNIADANCMSTIGYNIDTVQDLTRAINDGNIYVNVHSEAYPNGVIRGNLPAGDGDDSNGGHDDGNDHEHGWKDDDHDGKSDWYKDRDGTWKDSCNDWSDHNSDGKHDWNNKEWDNWNKDHGDKNWNDSKDNHNDWNSNNDNHRKNDDHDKDRKDASQHWNHNGNHDQKDGRDGKDGKDGKDGNNDYDRNRDHEKNGDKQGKNDNYDRKTNSHQSISRIISNVRANVGVNFGR